MRPWFLVALLCAALTLGCSTLNAEPARVQPSRSLPLQIDFANTYHNEHVRVVETVWLDPYPVDARGSLTDIREELDQIGPQSDVAGRRFDALTTWGLRWSSNFEQAGAACSLRQATIEVEAIITLPELDRDGDLSPAESGLWQDYLAALRAHEDGHVNIYRAAAQELSNEILALGVMPDCDQLRSALAVFGETKIGRISQVDLIYDQETGHGAIFPTQE